jgi:hypothetical protein
MTGHYDGFIYAYHALTGALSWKSDVTVYDHTSNYGIGYSLQFVDFGSDGKVELLAGNRIYDAATGKLLLDLGDTVNKGLSQQVATHYRKYIPATGDLDGDGKPEYAAGNQVYSIHITNNDGTDGNTSVLLASIPAQTFGTLSMTDGNTLLADINEDGRLDVFASKALSTTTIGFFAWDVQTGAVIAKGSTASSGDYHGMPFVGNVDTIPGLEILFTTTNRIKGFRYTQTSAFEQVYEHIVDDPSGGTGITLFDFNQDGKSELVYRDRILLRIMQAVPAVGTGMGTFKNLYTTSGGSGTAYEYPIVADVDSDGGAEIITVAGATDAVQGTLRIYKSGARPWAPARKVWNQFSYNAVNINEDLTVPRYPLNPFTVFPGKDGVLGTDDDVRPYNNFLQQQTTLNTNGTPLWLTPDAIFDDMHISTSVVGDSVSISLCIVNRGDAALGSPVYAALYRDSVKPANWLATDSLVGYILPGDTGCLTVGVGNITSFPPFVQLVVRLNDNNGAKYPVQDECDCGDSIRTRLSPVLHLLMKKDATLNGIQHNGTYPNPVSVLYTDVIEYKITAVNANLSSTGTLVICDTLPAYLDYDGKTPVTTPPLTATFTHGFTAGTPPRDTLAWTFTGVPSLDTVTVTFGATPVEGVSASQPMFVNRARITAGDTIHLPTGNNTYHQGAGVSIVTFSAPAKGGGIFNATPRPSTTAQPPAPAYSLSPMKATALSDGATTPAHPSEAKGSKPAPASCTTTP